MIQIYKSPFFAFGIVCSLLALSVYYLYSKTKLYDTALNEYKLSSINQQTKVENLAKLLALLQQNPVQSTVSQLSIGTIVLYGGIQSPDDYMFCDGAALLISEYPDLYKILSTTYNTDKSMDSSIYFQLPDLTDKFVRCYNTKNNARKLGEVEKYKTAMPTNAFKTTAAGRHDHRIWDNGQHQHLIEVNKVWGRSDMDAGYYASAEGALNGTAIKQTALSGMHSHACEPNGDHSHSIIGGDNETCPTNITLHYIIKVK